MDEGAPGTSGPRTRREPPPFRRVRVGRNDILTPRMRRVVLEGEALDGLVIDEPASSVRLLLPPHGTDALVMPAWSGNQFELPGGERAPIRTFTPRFFDTPAKTLTIDVVVHDHGAASDWVRSAAPGAEVAVSGPGRGDPVDPTVSSHLLVGDESAIPAISQLLESIPDVATVHVDIEIAERSARLELPHHPGATVTWHLADPAAAPGEAMADAVLARPELPERVWIAGEAAAVQRLRRHLFDERGLDRSTVTVRGYWKHGRSAT